MSEQKHIRDRARAATDFSLPAYLRRWIVNLNDNISWSSSSDSSESSTSSTSSSTENEPCPRDCCTSVKAASARNGDRETSTTRSRNR